jgi:hypothetical protein
MRFLFDRNDVFKSLPLESSLKFWKNKSHAGLDLRAGWLQNGSDGVCPEIPAQTKQREHEHACSGEINL